MRRRPTSARDDAEIAAILGSLESGRRVLGISRGAQLLAVAFGGVLDRATSPAPVTPATTSSAGQEDLIHPVAAEPSLGRRHGPRHHHRGQFGPPSGGRAPRRRAPGDRVEPGRCDRGDRGPRRTRPAVAPRTSRLGARRPPPRTVPVAALVTDSLVPLRHHTGARRDQPSGSPDAADQMRSSSSQVMRAVSPHNRS